MGDDLDVTEAVTLDHIMAILYVGWDLAGEGLTEEEAQACIEHFSPNVKWRGMAVKWEFQTLRLAKKWSRNHQLSPAASPLDQNNTALGRQLPRRSM